MPMKIRLIPAVFALIGSGTAQLTASPCTTITTGVFRSERLGMEFVSTPEALQWAVGNGTELIFIKQDLDLRTAPVATNKFNCGVLNVTTTAAIQGACEVGPDNPTGMCTLDVYEDGFQINPGSGAAAAEDSGKLLLSNIRMRQRPVEVGGVVLPTSGHAGLVWVGNEELWLKDVFLEGSALSPRARGLDIEAGVAVYMEGGGITEMKEPNHGPAFRMGAGSTATFSNVAFSNIQLTSSVTPDVYTEDNVAQEGQYGPLGKLSASAAVTLIECEFTNVTVQGVPQTTPDIAVGSRASVIIDGVPGNVYDILTGQPKTSDTAAGTVFPSAQDEWFMGIQERLRAAQESHVSGEASVAMTNMQIDPNSATSSSTSDTDAGSDIVPAANTDGTGGAAVLPLGSQELGPQDTPSGDENRSPLYIVLAVGIAVLVCLTALLCFLARWQRNRARRRKQQQIQKQADQGAQSEAQRTMATCGTSAELGLRLKHLTDDDRLNPNHSIDSYNAAHGHPQGQNSQGPYLPVPWQNAPPQEGQRAAQAHAAAGGNMHAPNAYPYGSQNGQLDPYHVPNGTPGLESSRSDIHRDGYDTEYIEDGTVEPQWNDFPERPPVHLPPVDPTLEAHALASHLPAPSSSEPTSTGSQQVMHPHIHRGKTGHAQVPAPPNHAASWHPGAYTGGNGSSYDVSSQQPLLPQKHTAPPDGAAAAPVLHVPRHEYRHDVANTAAGPASPDAAALPPQAATAAATVPHPQLLSEQPAAGEPQPQWPAAAEGQEGDAALVPHSQTQPQGEKGLIEALDQCSDNGTLLFDRYVVRGTQDRRFGGQGVVQFAQDPHTQEQYAIKFFTKRAGFERERKLYDKPTLRSMMPAVIEVVPNADNRYATADGFVFPPCLVVERGESLDEWARRIEPGFLTILSVLCDVATRLQQLHHAGYVHRDVKPGNVLWRPTQFSWTLIDFGCAAAIGTQCGLSFSLLYAPPEVINAVEAQARGMRADPKTDMWAMGVIAYELLTRSRIFPTSLTKAEVRDRITGRVPLPWEEPEAQAGGHRQLRILKHTVLACLHRDPNARPTAAKLLRSWNRIFDTFSAGSGGVGTTTNVLAGRQQA